MKIGNVKPGLIDFDGCSFVATSTTKGLDRFKLNQGDLLVGMTGSYVGESGLVTNISPHAYINQRVGRFLTPNKISDLGYVYCAVRSSDFRRFSESQSYGSAQPNVSGSSLSSYKVTIATPEIFNKFNGVVEQIIRSILQGYEISQSLKQLRDTLLPRLISGQLRLPVAEKQATEALAE